MKPKFKRGDKVKWDFIDLHAIRQKGKGIVKKVYPELFPCPTDYEVSGFPNRVLFEHELVLYRGRKSR